MLWSTNFRNFVMQGFDGSLNNGVCVWSGGVAIRVWAWDVMLPREWYVGIAMKSGKGS